MIPNRRNRLTGEIKVQIVSDYVSGMPLKEIQERYKISKATIYNTLRDSSVTESSAE